MMMMLMLSLLLLYTVAASVFRPLPKGTQHPIPQHNDGSAPDHVSPNLFASLERFSRLVDITYCVGTTGIVPPFSCVSRCDEFPTLDLVTTWNTGVLMSDSCGYIAIDHGAGPKSFTRSGRVNSREDTMDIKSRGAIIVAFRGTYSITNTVVDLSTIPQEYVPYPSPDHGGSEPPREPKYTCHNCTVHMGFLTSWEMARTIVLPALEPLRKRYPDYPIYLVGHSLGGAVAALAALELKVISGWDKMIVTTFGEPRVGNDGFVEYLNSVFELGGEEKPIEARMFRRVTHVDDPVPSLPLSEWGYKSHAGEFFISKSDLPPGPSDIRACAGNHDPRCIAGSAGEPLKRTGQILAEEKMQDTPVWTGGLWDIPSRFKLWQLFFAHRDYFWRLGLCVPGGDPIDWGRDKYPNYTNGDEL
ncbi:alpha/beta-hydrolase [Annulohypoxylon maeteangense]|uniref:alpha/beta-hydrolase n=1 Tax=Annulohypoxylon maeteangense TaxID=1927788 RepID=UPI0020072CF0|nr:alpha/beta-hydrolase [Annulohypoxylon maeteangense]KAI0890056.1 alpha/beta-hydrolase [Annulohypoxylon maeteangense]